jgi:hypothetical protein
LAPLLHFAITLFVSAFILFLVQPLIGKLILPKLGGTPQVWNTCMVFFQMVLLLGYGYTHFVSTRLKPRTQVMLHSFVMLLPFVIFFLWPFWEYEPLGVKNYIKTWIPNFGGNPIFVTLLLLGMVIGIPFFVVSTTAPLLQKWFGFTGHEAAKDPYFLYGASNLGSMLSLLVYPALIEPFSFLNTQALIWMGGYTVLVALVIAAVIMIWKPTGAASAARVEAGRPEISTQPVSGEVLAAAIQSKPSPPRTSAPTESTPTRSIETVSGLRRLRWVALAAVPSSMMLGVTSHITTDLSPIPLFWLIPLAFYLLSFILVFARWPVVWVEKPHTFMLIMQPLAVALMIFFEMSHHLARGQSESPWPVISFNLIGFILTVMVCHGELAKDRPSVRYLTDFYLMMSVGGVVGGMLNALIAPLFPYVFELNLAIIAACFLRPNLPFGNWLDGLFTKLADNAPAPQHKGKGGKAAAVPSVAVTDATPGLSYGLDVAVGIFCFALAFLINIFYTRSGLMQVLMYGSGFLLVVALIGSVSRGLRFGLAIAAIIFAFELNLFWHDNQQTLHRSRSYFGVIKVKQSRDEEDGELYTTLIHGHINHGANYSKRDEPGKDFSRLATTYYHRKGPAGIVMEKFNWSKDPNSNNTYHADARMPAGLIAQGAFGALGTGVLPFGDLVEAWTEPPYATIGLGTGTMASYARPFQHIHFYEIDDQIRRLSLPGKGRGATYFTYLQDALDRGAHVQVLMGDARQRMAQPYYNYYDAEKNPQERPNGGPEKFYHMMVVDAFSSDAIPAHLLTKEAFKMYFDHLTEDGILCVHTSNRYVDLPRVVADVAEEGGYVATVGKDSAPRAIAKDPREKGHFTSEWVMVARKAKDAQKKINERDYLKHLTEPAGYKEAVRKEALRENRQASTTPYWSPPRTHSGKYLWTDDYYNLLTILRLFVGGRDD